MQVGELCWTPSRTTSTYVAHQRRAGARCCLRFSLTCVCQQLSDEDMRPSYATLARYGNTSSSSIWYELDYVRRHGHVARGHQALQIAFGSGFMCNSAVWTALRPVDTAALDPRAGHATPWVKPANTQ